MAPGAFDLAVAIPPEHVGGGMDDFAPGLHRARDPRVVQVSVSLSGSWSVIDIVRADGFVASDIRPLVRLNVSIVAKDAQGRRESGVPRKRRAHLGDHATCGQHVQRAWAY